MPSQNHYRSPKGWAVTTPRYASRDPDYIAPVQPKSERHNHSTPSRWKFSGFCVTDGRLHQYNCIASETCPVIQTGSCPAKEQGLSCGVCESYGIT